VPENKPANLPTRTIQILGALATLLTVMALLPNFRVVCGVLAALLFVGGVVFLALEVLGNLRKAVTRLLAPGDVREVTVSARRIVSLAGEPQVCFETDGHPPCILPLRAGREVKPTPEGLTVPIPAARTAPWLVVVGWGVVPYHGAFRGALYNDDVIGVLVAHPSGQRYRIALPAAISTSPQPVLGFGDCDPLLSGLPTTPPQPAPHLADKAQICAVAQFARSGERWDPDIWLFNFANVWAATLRIPKRTTAVTFLPDKGSLHVLGMAVAATPRPPRVSFRGATQFTLLDPQDLWHEAEARRAELGEMGEAARGFERAAQMYLVKAYAQNPITDRDRAENFAGAIGSLTEAAKCHDQTPKAAESWDPHGTVRCYWALFRIAFQAFDIVPRDVMSEALSRVLDGTCVASAVELVDHLQLMDKLPKALEASKEYCREAGRYVRSWLLGWAWLDMARATESAEAFGNAASVWLEEMAEPAEGLLEIVELALERCEVLESELADHRWQRIAKEISSQVEGRLNRLQEGLRTFIGELASRHGLSSPEQDKSRRTT